MVVVLPTPVGPTRAPTPPRSADPRPGAGPHQAIGAAPRPRAPRCGRRPRAGLDGARDRRGEPGLKAALRAWPRAGAWRRVSPQAEAGELTFDHAADAGELGHQAGVWSPAVRTRWPGIRRRRARGDRRTPPDRSAPGGRRSGPRPPRLNTPSAARRVVGGLDAGGLKARTTVAGSRPAARRGGKRCARRWPPARKFRIGVVGAARHQPASRPLPPGPPRHAPPPPPDWPPAAARRPPRAGSARIPSPSTARLDSNDRIRPRASRSASRAVGAK